MKRVIGILLLCSAFLLGACGKTEEFTNKQGSETTICAHEGCSKYIARSGDTLYCEKHSSVCSSCGCYINEGETMCTQCKIDALDSLEPTESQSNVAAFNNN